MLMISPRSKDDPVNLQVSDRSSVLRFLETRLGIGESNISPSRSASTDDVASGSTSVGRIAQVTNGQYN